MVKLRHLLAGSLVILSLLVSTPFAQAPPDLDADVARAMKTFDVPGIGLAIVKDGRVLVARGYGVRRLGAPDTVDAKTLFAIASNSKVLTATALALLVDEGKIEWDASVIRYLPGFQMWDPYVTRELTVRDLLVHRSGLGLGAGDLLWWPPSTYDRKEIVRRLQFIRPVTSFRSSYAYDNVLYLVAGEVIEAVSGKTWEQFVGERILDKVGMTGSSVRHAAIRDTGNAAAPHAPIDGVVREIKPFDSDNTNPAGGICSSPEDMAKWMLVLLADGRLPDGSRLFSAQSARELHGVVTPIRVTDPPAELAAQKVTYRGYALGLGIHDYRGKRVVTHTGGLPGYVSKVTLLPELGLGVAVLTNQESGEAYGAITYQVLDYYLGGRSTDWVDAYAKARERRMATVAKAAAAAERSRDVGSRPSLALDRYAGKYNDAWYGDVEIVEQYGKLIIRFARTPALVGDLEHWQHDTLVARWHDRELRADAYVTFSLNPDGSIDQAKMVAVSPDTDFSFDFHDLLLKPVQKQPRR